MKRANKSVEDVNKWCDVEVTLKNSSGQSKTFKGTDIDIVADGTFWQVKAGPSSLNDPVKFRAWIEQALLACKQDSSRQIGLKLDPDARRTFENVGQFRAIWEEAKSKYPTRGWSVETMPAAATP